MIDINYFILKEEYQLLSEDYYDSFIEIGKKKIIPLDFADKIAECAGLRNALAHEYDRIDAHSVYKAIRLSLSQVPEYLNFILDFVSK